MVVAPTSLVAVRTIADRLGTGSEARQQLRVAEIDGLGRVTDTDGSAGSIEADGWRGESGAAVHPTSVAMATAAIMNKKRMNVPGS